MSARQDFHTETPEFSQRLGAADDVVMKIYPFKPSTIKRFLEKQSNKNLNGNGFRISDSSLVFVHFIADSDATTRINCDKNYLRVFFFLFRILFANGGKRELLFWVQESRLRIIKSFEPSFFIKFCTINFLIPQKILKVKRIIIGENSIGIIILSNYPSLILIQAKLIIN